MAGSHLQRQSSRELVSEAHEEMVNEFNRKYPVFNQLNELELRGGALALQKDKINKELEPINQRIEVCRKYKQQIDEEDANQKRHLDQQIAALEEQMREVHREENRLQELCDKILRENQEAREEFVYIGNVERGYANYINANERLIPDEHGREPRSRVGRLFKSKGEVLLEAYEKVAYIPEAFERINLSHPLREDSEGPGVPMLSKIAQPLEWIPPLRLGLLGAFNLFELAKVYYSKESAAIKAAKTFFIIAGVALAIAAFTNPIGVAVILSAAVIGAGVFKEVVNYYSANKDVQETKKQLQATKAQLARLVTAQADPANKNVSYKARIEFLEHTIAKQETHLAKMREVRSSKRNNLLLAAASVVGAVLLIFPPTAIIGGFILLGTICAAVGVKTGLFGAMWRGVKAIGKAIGNALGYRRESGDAAGPTSKAEYRPQVNHADEARAAPLLAEQHHASEGRSEKDILMSMEQPRAHSAAEANQMSRHAAKSVIEDLHSRTQGAATPVRTQKAAANASFPVSARNDDEDEPLTKKAASAASDHKMHH